jgi:hypothetical protein
VDGVTVGSYVVNAYRTNNPREFNIVSVGRVNNKAMTVTAKYGYTVDYSNGIPLSSVGDMLLRGHKVLFWKFMVNADGPINSAGTIDPIINGSNYVQYTGTVTQGAPVTAPSFWLYNRFDTQGGGVNIPHDNLDYILESEAATEEQAGAFTTNNVYTNNTVGGEQVIDDKDGYYYYYTTHLDNDPANPGYDATKPHLEIGPGESNYVSGDVTYSPYSVPTGKEIVFVDGDVDVILNAQSYWSSASDLTIVSMNNINIVQPVTGPDDRLTLIAYNDIATGGLNLGTDADVRGNLVMCAGGDFSAYLGGVSNGPIFAGGSVTVDTQWLIFFSARDFNMGTDNWGDSTNWPLGLPSDFPIFNTGYSIKNETPDTSTEFISNYNPRWQKRKSS